MPRPHLVVRAYVEANPANRAIAVVAESDDFYRSSEIQLDGERAPRTNRFEFRSLPSGTYHVKAMLIGAARSMRAVIITGMMVVLFRSKLVNAPDGYDAMAQEMEDLARTMPGFVDVKAFKAEDGERLTVVWWENEETLKGWRENVRHRVAQRLGRERWYEYYKIEVAEVVRQNAFTRDTAASTAAGPASTP